MPHKHANQIPEGKSLNKCNWQPSRTNNTVEKLTQVSYPKLLRNLPQTTDSNLSMSFLKQSNWNTPPKNFLKIFQPIDSIKRLNQKLNNSFYQNSQAFISLSDLTYISTQIS